MFTQVTTLGAYGGPVPMTFWGGIFVNALTFSLQLAGPISGDFAPPVPEQRCQVTDSGISVVVQVLDSAGSPVNLRMATSKSILVERPSGVCVTAPASFFTNGIDGQMYFSTGPESPVGTGLDEFGVWKIQGRIVLGGNLQFTQVGAFSVGSNLGV